MEKALHWPIIKKSYGYITRQVNGKTQILVFQHPVKEAGIQIPKGTVKHGEMPVDAVKREMEEETGLSNFPAIHYLIDDFWENDDGVIHHRYFYRINIDKTQDEWNYKPTGGGAEDGKVFRFFWVTPDDGKQLIRGHADYFRLISLN
ncbi:NUDIX domain-containing protein [Solibacillus sp. A46]|uniref:NUDIX domain-containing protein n=2 Tax=Caryophanaceae TaxID=186818 RepID=A0ABR8XYC6_9BACL|nr:NUDIX domain-containing protein [Solibacillus faecavium]